MKRLVDLGARKATIRHNIIGDADFIKFISSSVDSLTGTSSHVTSIYRGDRRWRVGTLAHRGEVVPNSSDSRPDDLPDRLSLTSHFLGAGRGARWWLVK